MGSNLINKLPFVRGKYVVNSDLSKVTWFRVGGSAEVVFKPADVDDLCAFMQEKPNNIPVHIMGVGSNLLVRDGGIPGVVIRLGRGFTNLFIDGEYVDVGAGYLDRNLAFACSEEGLEGLEFFAGIPGTIGGALRMNAGCYESEVKDVLVYAIAVDGQGKIHQVNAADCEFSYRHCGLPEDWIFVSARFKVTQSVKEKVQKTISEMLEKRENTQPIRTRTGGSTFANPAGEKAWELIDRAGCRGLQIGGAQMSPMHCNFMVNTGEATARDLERLGEEVRSRVQKSSGIELRWEIQRVGVPQMKRTPNEEAA
jgi:UDP-N-acetylmuramate dehydrogenase